MAGRSSKNKQKGGAPSTVAAQVAEMKEGILQIESFMKEATELAAGEIGRLDGIREALQSTAAGLEAELRAKEAMLRRKDSVREEMEKELTAQVHELQVQLRTRDELLERRETEIADLRSRLDALTLPPEGSVPLDEANVVLLEEVEPVSGQDPCSVGTTAVGATGLAGGAGAVAKIKVIEQSMRDVVVRPGRMAKRETGTDPGKSRLGSLLAPVKKRS